MIFQQTECYGVVEQEGSNGLTPRLRLLVYDIDRATVCTMNTGLPSPQTM